MVRSRRFALSLVCIALLAPAVVPAWADSTSWQCDPSTPGDWFDPANWTNGVPTWDKTVFIGSGYCPEDHPAEISAGHAFADCIYFSDGYGNTHHGHIIHTNGTLSVAQYLWMACSSQGSGTYELSGSAQLSVGYGMEVGRYGGATFIQDGGTVVVRHVLDVGKSSSSSGQYELKDGELSVDYVGIGGKGWFIQTGGTNTTQYLNFSSDGKGTYELDGGQLNAASMWISGPRTNGSLFRQTGGVANFTEKMEMAGGTYHLSGGATITGEQIMRGESNYALFKQDGGINQINYLEILSGNRYEFTDGQLEVDGGVYLEGEFDFTGNGLTLTAIGGSLLNFATGSIMNSGQATLEAGPDSLVVFAPGIDPNLLFKSYTNAGITHTHGNTLDLVAGQRVAGWGIFDDHVNCRGQIEAKPGGWINLIAGLNLSSGGSVDLKGGRLRVKDQTSGMDGGTLLVNDMSVGGEYGPACFTQTAGENTIADELYVGAYDCSSSATYILSDTGLLSAKSETVAGYYCPGAFIQTGGTNTVTECLCINSGKGSATYELSGAGQLSSAVTHLTGKDAVFTQTGGSHATGDLKLEDEATYQLSGGQLVTGNVFLGADYFDEVSFIQTGGTHTVEGELVIARKGYNNSSYTLSNGELAACQLWIGEGSTGIFTQAGGSNMLGYLSIHANGTYEYKGGSLHVDGGLKIANGTLDLGGQDLTVDVRPGSIVDLSQATIENAGNGEMTVGDNSLVILSAGMDPSAIFRNYSNAGLTHIVGTPLVLEPGQSFSGIGTIIDRVDCRGTISGRNNGFLVFGDRLNHGGVDVSESGIINASGGSLMLFSGANSCVQSGGNVTADSFLVETTYELKGGDIACDTVEIGSYSGAFGFVMQTGGTFTVTDTMVVHERSACMPTDSYQLRSGALSVGNLYLGGGRSGFSENVAFLHWGGTNTVDRLVIARTYDEALYEIKDATLVVGSLVIGYCGGHGTFRIANSNTQISVTDSLLFGSRGVFSAVAGSEIHMTGSAFQNESTNSANLAGLRNLTLIFEGGSEDIDPFEVAGKDMGAVIAGFESNFALGTLQLGGGDIGQIQLVDTFDNQPGWVGSEALYTNILTVSTGSILHLNGLTLYYYKGEINGTVLEEGGALVPIEWIQGDANWDIKVDGSDLNLLLTGWGTGTEWQEGDFNGDLAVNDSDLNLLLTNWTYPPASGSSVPEPATLALLIVGGLAMLKRKPQRRGDASGT